jgi:hypothetical protein
VIDARKRLQLLGLAHQDMRIALELVRHLKAVGPGRGELRFGIEAGIDVVYARPFTGSKIGELDRSEWAPEVLSLQHLHYELLNLRDKLYAHTERYTKSGRRIRTRDESEPPGDYTHEWPGWLPGIDDAVATLLELQEQRLRGATEEAQTSYERAVASAEELRLRESAGAKPRPSPQRPDAPRGRRGGTASSTSDLDDRVAGRRSASRRRLQSSGCRTCASGHGL